MRAGNRKVKVKNLSRREWRALSFCILIAATIWLLRALNKEATTLVQVPLVVTNGLPAGYMVASNTVEVELQASGFLLLRTKYFKRIKPLEIKACTPASSNDRCAIGVLDFERDLLKLLGNDRSIISVQPDSIIVRRPPQSNP